jgi:plasmid stabilization system protein ParE
MQANIAAIKTLGDHPDIGRLSTHPGVWELVCREHRIIYRQLDADDRQSVNIIVIDIFGPGEP